MARRATVTLALAALCLAACSADPGGGDPAPASKPTSDRPAGSGTPPPPADPATTQPLALAVHPARAPVRIDLATARALRRGDLRTWERLDGSATPLRLIRRARPVDRIPVAGVQLLPAGRLRPGLVPIVVAGRHPLRHPASYPLRVPGTRPPPVTTVRVVGDIMLGRGVAAAHPGAGPAAPLAALAGHLAAADLTIGNLESTLSTAGPPQQGGDSFAAAPGAARALAALGIDAVSLANNHTGDFGDTALRRTLARVRGSGLAGFGAGTDLRAAARPVILETPHLRVALVGFNAIGETPAATRTGAGALSLRMPPRTGPLDRSDLRRVLATVREADRRADVVLVVPHWGAQYTHVADPAQHAVARRLVAAGADLVVGGHPHWVQGLERVDDAVVAHSLGNLVFDMDFMTETMEGVTLTATFWGSSLRGVELSPYVLDERFRPRLARGPRGRAVLADVWRHSRGAFRAP